MRAEKAEEEVADLVKKSQQLETELDITHERLSIVTMQLEEKEKALMAAEAEVNRRVISSKCLIEHRTPTPLACSRAL